MIALKTLVSPATRRELTLDESACLSWIAFRTNGFDLPAGSNVGDLASLSAGGEIAPAVFPTLQATIHLWTGRLRQPLRMHGSWGWMNTQNQLDLRAMLDRQGVVYEDRRRDCDGARAYRRGRSVGSETANGVFVNKKGERIPLSALGDVAAMVSLLEALAQSVGECSAAGQPLRIITRVGSEQRPPSPGMPGAS